MHQEINADLVAHLKKQGASINDFDISDPVLRGKTVSEVLKALEFINNEPESKNELGAIEKLYSKALGTNKQLSMDYAETGKWLPLEELSKKICRATPLMRDRTILVCTGTDTIIVSKSHIKTMGLGRSDVERYVYLMQSTITRDPVAAFITTEHKSLGKGDNVTLRLDIKKLVNLRDFDIPNANLCIESKYRSPSIIANPHSPKLEYEEVEEEELKFISEIVAASQDLQVANNLSAYKPVLISSKGVEAAIEPRRRFKYQTEGYGRPIFSPTPKTKDDMLSAVKKAARRYTNYWTQLNSSA